METYSIVRSNKIRETDRDDYEIDEVELSRDVWLASIKSPKKWYTSSKVITMWLVLDGKPHKGFTVVWVSVWKKYTKIRSQ